MVTNQTSINGPKAVPTRAVPKRCTTKRPMRMTTVSGTTAAEKFGLTSLRPSMAESTEMAGVMMPSPYRSAAPMRPRAMSTARRRRRCDVFLRMSASMARMPPSPRLSARMMKTMYLKLTTRISDQRISDSTPYTLSGVGVSPYSGLKHSRRA